MGVSGGRKGGLGEGLRFFRLCLCRLLMGLRTWFLEGLR